MSTLYQKYFQTHLDEVKYFKYIIHLRSFLRHIQGHKKLYDQWLSL